MRIPLFVGSSYVGASINAANEELINLFPEVAESDGAVKKTSYRGVPGRTLLTTGIGRGRAAFSQDGRSFAVLGGGLYELDPAWTLTFRGAVPDDGRMATIHSNGTQLMIIGGGLGFILTLATNVFAQITDPQFPSGAALMGEFMDDYFIVLTRDFFALSALGDGTSWDADQAQNDNGDRLVAIKVVGTKLWTFGSAKSVPWYNSGAASFPFAPIPGIVIHQGCAAEFSPQVFDNSVAWLTQNADGDRLVVRDEQYTPRRISTHALEAALRKLSRVDDAVGWTSQIDGHAFYTLNFPTGDTARVFDAATQLWHRREALDVASGSYTADRGIAHMQAFGTSVVLDRANGKIYAQSVDVYDDAGVPLRRLRRIPLPTNELARMFISRVHLDVEPGVGLSTGQGIDPQVSCRLSVDGGHLWGAERWKSLGAQGDYGLTVDWWRWRAARRPVLEFTQTDPVKTFWLDGYVDGEAGTS